MVKGPVARLLRRFRLPPWIVWLVLSAMLFLARSASFGMGESHRLAQVGVIGAVAAIAVIAAFSG